MMKNLKSNRRIFGVIAIFILFGCSVIMVEYTGRNVITGVRGYIYGEGQWTKAQKQATIALLNFIHTEEKRFYSEFEEALKVHEGDRIGRETLMSENPDKKLAYEGFLRGKNQPDDIDSMIWLFSNFKDIGVIQDAIEFWEEGDQQMNTLRMLAIEIYGEIQQGGLTDDQVYDYLERISALEEGLTELETNFSDSMNAAGQWASNTIYWLTIGVSIGFIFVAGFVSVTFLRSLQRSNEKHLAAERKFRHVLDNSRDLIFQLNLETGSYEYISSSVKEITGYSSEEIMKGGTDFILDRIHPEDKRSMQAELEKLKTRKIEDLATQDTEFRFKNAGGKYIWLKNKRSPVLDENGNLQAIVGNIRDISAEKRRFEKTDRSLHEKKTLLSEVHHRVKNNLSIVSSLIEMKKWEMEDKEQEVFSELQFKIKSIALVHEKLYNNETYSVVELSEYIRDLAGMISRGYASSRKHVEVEYDMEEMEVEITRAVPIGLACNELINNSYKHSFSNINDGWLKIELQKRDDMAVLTVYNNGDSLPDDFSIEEQSSLGMTLLKSISNQLNGSIEVLPTEKTAFRVTFDIGKHKSDEI